MSKANAEAHKWQVHPVVMNSSMSPTAYPNGVFESNGNLKSERTDCVNVVDNFDVRISVSEMLQFDTSS